MFLHPRVSAQVWRWRGDLVVVHLETSLFGCRSYTTLGGGLSIEGTLRQLSGFRVQLN